MIYSVWIDLNEEWGEKPCTVEFATGGGGRMYRPTASSLQRLMNLLDTMAVYVRTVGVGTRIIARRVRRIESHIPGSSWAVLEGPIFMRYGRWRVNICDRAGNVTGTVERRTYRRAEEFMLSALLGETDPLEGAERRRPVQGMLL